MLRFCLLICSLILVVGCAAPPPEPAAAVDPFAADDRVEVATTVAFTEGPTAYKDGSIFFTEMTTERIYRYHPEDGRLEVFRDGSNRANGLIFDAEWRLIACEGGTPPGGAPRVTRTNMETGEVEVLVDSYQGKRLHQPNDVTFDSKGRLYFSDRPLATIADDQTGVHAVYRIDPDGSVDQILAEPDIRKPNGIAISPDDTTLYLIEAHPDANLPRMIRAYDLAEDGTVSNMRVFHDFYPGRSGDGMTIDSAGNLYICAGLHRTRDTSETLDTVTGVHVFNPAGEKIDFYPIPEDTITNATFAGPDLKTLYITAGKTLFRIHTDVAGTRR